MSLPRRNIVCLVDRDLPIESDEIDTLLLAPEAARRRYADALDASLDRIDFARVLPSSEDELTPEQLRICRQTGCSVADFVRARRLVRGGSR